MYSVRCGAVLFVLFSCACDDGIDDPEPDNATLFDERRIDTSVVRTPSFAVEEVDGVAWAAVGAQIVRVPAAGKAVTILQGLRVHGALAHDASYVYFASQSARYGIAPYESKMHVGGGHLDDGAIYRARRDGTGSPEKLVDVGVLVGAFALTGGHLYVCESPGLNADGDVLDVTLTGTPSASRITMRMNEYCEGVVADEKNLYLAMNASHKTLISGDSIVEFPRTIELARVSRDADTSAIAIDGPPRFATTAIEPGFDGMFLDDEGIALTTGDKVVRYGLDGASKPAPQLSSGSDLVAPHGPDWLEASSGSQTNTKDDSCHGGRVWLSHAGERRELTQAVCTPRAFGGSSFLWFVETADLTAPGCCETYGRLRLKRLDLPR